MSQLSSQQPRNSGAGTGFPTGYNQGLREQMGFWPHPECTYCQGTGYQLGRNNEICVVCPGTNYQPNFNQGYGNQNLNQGLGNQGYGNQHLNQGQGNQGYGNQHLNQGLENQNLNQGYGNQHQSLRDRLGFVPNTSCKKCNGTGMRVGKKGKEKVCKTCKTSWEKNPQNTNQNYGSGSTSINNQNLTFTPISNCHLCKGTGFLKDKNNEICRLCASHVPVSDVSGGLTNPNLVGRTNIAGNQFNNNTNF